MRHDEAQVAILRDRQGREVALKGVRAQARLHGLMAEVEVEQSYRNPEQTNIEAVYTFPLPLGAVLLGLEAEIAGKKLAGSVVERKQAERDYEDAVTDGNSAVMLEEAGPGLYTASLGNLMAGESAVIRYRYGLLLAWQGPRLRFLLPTTIAPRYGDAAAAGLQPHQVPVSALDVEYPLELSVSVEGDLAAAAIASPSHPVSLTRTDAGVRVRLSGQAALDRDFVLTLESDQAQSSCVLVPDGDRHVALASLRLPVARTAEACPLALKILIDCSGSMAGTSIAQARKAALEILNQLSPADSFNVTLFGSGHHHFFPRLMPATAQHITAAWNQLDVLEADMGGTEMGKAIEVAFGLSGPDGQATMLLITDGEIHEHEKLVRHARTAGHRVFVVGVGAAVAETFLKSLADATGGACELVAPQEGMAERVLGQFHRMRQPRIGPLTIEWPAPVAWQTDLPETVFAGDTVHVFAGFEQPVSGEVRLAGERMGEVIATIAPASEPGIPRLAAAKRMATVGEAEGLRLALNYQLLSRWTNFLVLAERADKAEELPALHQVPQMLAAGWGGTGNVRANMSVLACAARTHNADGRGGSGLYDVPAFLRRVSCDTAPQLADCEDAFADLDESFLRCDTEESPRRMRFSRSGRRPALTSKDPSGSAARSSATPARFIDAMEAALSHLLRQPRLPTRIVELERYGLPPEVAGALGDLVRQGLDEADVVVAFLLALLGSQAAGRFSRSFRLAVLMAWKKAAAGGVGIRPAISVALAQTTADQWHWTPVLPAMATAP